MKWNVPAVAFFAVLVSCNNNSATSEEKAKADSIENAENKVVKNGDVLLEPYTTKSTTKQSKVTGWEKGQMPVAPEGFVVTRFAEGLQHPRWIYVADNGDVFVSQADKEKSANNILLFRDTNKDGIAESKTVFLKGLDMPFGMLILKDKFYVANTGALVEYPYKEGATSISASGQNNCFIACRTKALDEKYHQQ